MELDGKEFALMLVVIGLLTTVSAAQTLQLSNLEVEFEEQLEALEDIEPSEVSVEGSTDLEESTEELPGMVGGC